MFSLYAEFQCVICYCFPPVCFKTNQVMECVSLTDTVVKANIHTQGHTHTQEHIPHSHIYIYAHTHQHTPRSLIYNSLPFQSTLCAVRTAPVRDNNCLHSLHNGRAEKTKERNVCPGNLVIRRTYKPQEDMIEFPLFPLCFSSRGTLPI